MTKKGIFKFLKWFVGILIAFIILISASVYFFKDNLIAKVIAEVNSHLNVKVKVKKIDVAFWSSFPNLSVDFNEIFIPDAFQDSSLSTDTLFYSEKIRFRFNPMDLWKKKYRLKQIDVYPGTLKLKVNKKGFDNFTIFKKTENQKDSEFGIELQHVYIEDLRFSYFNEKINHRYATKLLKTELEGKFADQNFVMHAKSEQIIQETRSGEINFVKNKTASFDINLEIDQAKGTLKIPKTEILIAQLPFQFEGYLSPKDMRFQIQAKQLKLVDVVQNFTMEQVDYVTKYDGSGNTFFNMIIAGGRSENDFVSVDCKFGIQNGKITEPTHHIQLSNLELNGYYSNKGGKEAEFLELKNISFTNKAGLFKGNLKINQFDTPHFEGKAKGNINLATVQQLLSINYIDSVSGNVKLNTNFDFDLLSQAEPKIQINRCEGEVEFQNNSLKLANDNRIYQEINGLVYLKNNDVGIENFSIKLKKSDIQLTGLFTDIIPYFKRAGNLKASVNLQSKQIQIEDLASISKVAKIEKRQARTYVLPQNILANLSISIGELNYSGHQFNQINGELNLKKHELNFSGISFTTSDANVVGTVSIRETSEEHFQTNSNLSSSNIKLKQLMHDWDNFQQKVILSKHVSGKAAANLKLNTPFDLRTGINLDELKADLDLKIIDGRLKNVETFIQIVEELKTPTSNLLLGKRNIEVLGEKLSDLKFDTLQNTLQIRNNTIIIPEMEINSSAIDIVSSGKHTFDNHIDYRFSFYLRDLKQEKQNEFGEVMDDGTGIIIYLKMFGTLENPQFKWDKEANQMERKAYNQQEKENVKSMLKTKFGLFQKDTSVQEFEEIEKPKAIIEVEYGNEDQLKEELITEKKKKNTKINRFLQKLKTEKEIEEKDKLVIEIE